MLAKTQRGADSWVTSDVIASYCARRMPEGRLQSEDITSLLNRVSRMAMPQLVRMKMRTNRCPTCENITNRLAT